MINSVTFNKECLLPWGGISRPMEMHISPKWRCNILQKCLQLFPKKTCNKQPSEPAAKRHQNEHRNHKRHRQHTGARIPQPRRPSRDHIHQRRDQRDQIRDLRIIRKDLPLPLANADAEAQQLQYDDQYVCSFCHITSS